MPPKLRMLLQDFAIIINDRETRSIEKKERRKLMNIAEIVFENYLIADPIYEIISKILDEPIEKSKDRLLKCYASWIDNKERRVLSPIAGRIAKLITDPSPENIKKLNLFEKEHPYIQHALSTILQLEEKKKQPHVQPLKKRKISEPELTPLQILKSKLVGQILCAIEQKGNNELREILYKKIDEQNFSETTLPPLQDALKALPALKAKSPVKFINPINDGIIVISDDENEKNHQKVPNLSDSLILQNTIKIAEKPKEIKLPDIKLNSEQSVQKSDLSKDNTKKPQEIIKDKIDGEIIPNMPKYGTRFSEISYHEEDFFELQNGKIKNNSIKNTNDLVNNK